MNRKDGKTFDIRFAQEADIPFILNMIHALARYEKMEDQVVATPELLAEWIFRKQTAEVLIGEEDGRPVAFALFFTISPPFWGAPASIWKISSCFRKCAAEDMAGPCLPAWRQSPKNAAAGGWNGAAWIGTGPVSTFTSPLAHSL